MTDWTGNPNSQNQLWSKWEFGIEASPRRLPKKSDVEDNARRYFAAGFGTAGKLAVKLLRTPTDATLLRRATYYYITVMIEGPPAHDPGYREYVRRDFTKKFVEAGFGQTARLVMFRCNIMAGDKQDGTPPEQLIVLPSIRLSDLLHI